ncbi:MAG: hypothetical protein WCE30_07910 [Mycobacterium sp.]
MGEENGLVPATIHAVPTHDLETAVEQYIRAVSGSTGANGDKLDIGRQRVELANEWRRVQSAVVYEMSWLGASQDRQQLACASVIFRVLQAADDRLRDEGLYIPRQLVCDVCNQATPETPVNIR